MCPALTNFRSTHRWRLSFNYSQSHCAFIFPAWRIRNILISLFSYIQTYVHINFYICIYVLSFYKRETLYILINIGFTFIY